MGKEIPEPALTSVDRIPSWLGGGFLFRAGGALYASEAFDGVLRPIVTIPAVSRDALGPRGVLVRSSDGQQCWVLDLASGARVPMAPVGLLDIAALADGRAAALTEGSRLFISQDRGYYWVDVTTRELGAPPTRLVTQAGGRPPGAPPRPAAPAPEGTAALELWITDISPTRIASSPAARCASSTSSRRLRLRRFRPRIRPGTGRTRPSWPRSGTAFGSTTAPRWWPRTGTSPASICAPGSSRWCDALAGSPDVPRKGAPRGRRDLHLRRAASAERDHLPGPRRRGILGSSAPSPRAGRSTWATTGPSSTAAPATDSACGAPCASATCTASGRRSTPSPRSSTAAPRPAWTAARPRFNKLRRRRSTHWASCAGSAARGPPARDPRGHVARHLRSRDGPRDAVVRTGGRAAPRSGCDARAQWVLAPRAQPDRRSGFSMTQAGSSAAGWQTARPSASRPPAR